MILAGFLLSLDKIPSDPVCLLIPFRPTINKFVISLVLRLVIKYIKNLTKNSYKTNVLFAFFINDDYNFAITYDINLKKKNSNFFRSILFFLLKTFFLKKRSSKQIENIEVTLHGVVWGEPSEIAIKIHMFILLEIINSIPVILHFPFRSCFMNSVQMYLTTKNEHEFARFI